MNRTSEIMLGNRRSLAIKFLYSVGKDRVHNKDKIDNTPTRFGIIDYGDIVLEDMETGDRIDLFPKCEFLDRFGDRFNGVLYLPENIKPAPPERNR